jgi:hypothetical protein
MQKYHRLAYKIRHNNKKELRHEERLGFEVVELS